MAISEAFAGSEVVSTTEWSLTTDTAGPDADTNDGEYQVFLNLNALALSDVFEFRIYEKAQAADTQRVYYMRVFADAQGVDGAGWVSQPLLLMHGWDMTLKRTAGADRTITWSIRKIDHASGSGLDAAATRAALGLAAANLDTQLTTIDDFLDTEVAAIKTKTDQLTFTTANRVDSQVFGLQADAITAASMAADVTTELQTGLATAAALTTVDDFLDTEIAAIKAKTDLIPAAPAAVGDIPTAAVVADAVWDEDATGHQTQGTFGQAIGDPVADADTIWALVNTNLNATVGSRASQASVDIIDDFLDTEIAALPTAAGIADAVWDEAIAGHLAAGSTGLALNSAGGAGDPWSTAIPGAYGAGTAGKIVGDNINATISSRASQTTLDTLDNFVDTEVADIQARLPAALSAGGWMKSDVQTVLASASAANHLNRQSFGVLQGTADSGTTTTMVDAGLTQATDVFAGSLILFCGGTNRYASRFISSFTPGTDTVTWVEPLPSAVTTEDYIILPFSLASLVAVVDALPSGAVLGARFDTVDAANSATQAAITSTTDDIDTAIADIPTNAELATSQASADDATLAAIAALTIPSAGAIADQVWDEAIAGHLGAGSTGLALNAAGGAGDPWSTAIPGAYGAGTAGFILGTNINATILSRASQTTLDTLDNFVDNEITDLQAAIATLDNFVDNEIAEIQAAISDLPTNAELATAFGTADDAIAALLGTPINGSIALDVAAGGGGGSLDAAAVRAALGLATANLDTQLAGPLSANVTKVNGITVTGLGTREFPWRPV